MKKRIFSVLMAICLIALMVSTQGFALGAAGATTASELTVTEAEDSDGDGYVEIDTAGKLWWFTQQVNGGNRNLNAKLTADIDLAGTCGSGIGNWLPIGNNYSGHFNGQGFTISNLYMTGDELYVGLFGHIYGATIENVSVTGNVSSTLLYDGNYNLAASGGIVAYMDDGTVRNCHVDMTVSGGYTIGGICGKLDSDGLIENCTTLGSAQGDKDDYIGGIVGDLWSGTVRGCTNAATVGNILETASYAGGIAGASFGIIENCLNFGNVEIAGTYGGHGGITGNQGWDNIVRNCGNHGTVSGYNTGGIVADNCGIIENCYNVGSVSGTSEYVTPIASSRDGGTATNNYYRSDTTNEDGGRTADQFASGQVAYELNGSATTEESVWRQTLGTDSYPALSGKLVYSNSYSYCDNTAVSEYSNTQIDADVVHRSEEHKLVGNNNGTHNEVWSCCEAVVTENIACTTQNPDADCTTEEKCACGYVIKAAQSSHDFSGAYLSDAVGHWHKCANCEVTDTKAEHSGTDDNDCTTAVLCSSCGYTMTAAKDHTGTNDKLVSNGVIYHNVVWSCCGAVVTENVDCTASNADGSCSTAETCACGNLLIAAKDNHKLTYTASGNVITETCSWQGCEHKATTTLHAPENPVYDGTQKLATVTYSDGWAGYSLGAISYSGTANDGSAYTTAPIDAGEAVASITVSGMTASVNYTVAKATNEWTEAPTIEGWKYGELGNDPTAKAKFGDEIMFAYRAVGATDWWENPPAEAGSYEMRARVQASDNWELLETMVPYTIAKADPTADIFDFAPPANLDVCDGSEKEAIVTVKEGIEGVGSITVKYFKDGEPLDGAPTTVGTYTVKIEVAEGANFFAADDLTVGTFTFDITDETNHTNVMITSNGDGTHDKFCTVCEKVLADDAACVFLETVDDAYLVSPATCGSGAVYYKSCACGHISDETFTVGALDSDNHTGTNDKLVSDNAGKHNVVWNCCNAVVSENVACTPVIADDTCLTAETCICGYFIQAAATEHDFSGDYLSDTEGHWHKCKNCSVTDTKLAHTPEDDDGDCLTAVHCTACGFETTKGQIIHNFNNPNLYDESGHWHKCGRCDVTAAKFDHSFTVPQKDGTHHWNKCEECEAIDTKTGHTFTVLQKDSTDHWNKCSGCDATDTKVGHSATEDGDCTTEEKCSCGTVVIEGRDNHDFDNACDPDCNNDGCTHTRTIVHRPEDDDGDCTTDILCSVCDAVTTKGNASHTGGTATCTAKAKCSVCGTAYGNTLAHTPEADDGDCTTDILCSVCDTVTTKGEESHTGGTATCTAKAKCEVCDTEYGGYGAHNWDADWTTDSEKHWHKCLTDGCAVIKDDNPHSGGSATCKDLAKCEFCDMAYGALSAHGETEIKDAKDATCTAEGYTGDTYCKVCGEKVADGTKINALGHGETEVKDAKDATCTADGYTGDTYCKVCGEKVADGVKINALGHGETEVKDAKDATCTAEGYTGDTYCKTCGEKLESGMAITKTAHTYKDGKCTVCSKADPNYDPDVPQTGDHGRPGLWLIVNVISACGVLAAFAAEHRKSRKRR